MIHSPLDILTSLATKSERLICGIMSGTSVDAIDVALVHVRGGGTSTQVDVRYYAETLYPEEAQQLIFANTEVATSDVQSICLLHATIAHLYADAVRSACEEAGIAVRDIDLIGMHGQTVHHIPTPMQLGRHSVRATLQLGSGRTLATLLGVPVVSDFRAADMAAGGQGAPLVPYVDYLLFRSPEENRVLLNIGGIANMTWLPAGCDDRAVIAFDTGPGNMVIDAVMRQFYGKEFDEGGAVARAGRVNADLLSWLLGHPYFKMHYPKSTGRELFGTRYVEQMLQIARDLEIDSPAEIVTTASELTVRSISQGVRSVVPAGEPFVMLVSGGGARNQFFMESLRFALPNAVVASLASTGIAPDAKEAVSFAVLANEWLQGNPANLVTVTGAEKRVILGSFSI